MSKIYIAGIAMTVFGRHLERSLEDMAGEALQGALKDAGCKISDIGTAYNAGITNGPLQGQLAIPRQVVMSKIGIEQIPIFNIDNGCAAGSSAVHLAIQSLKTDASYQPPLDCAPCFERVCPLSHTRCLNDILPAQVKPLMVSPGV